MALSLERLRFLNTGPHPESGRPDHIAAASGLIFWRNEFLVLADDELSLGIFPRDPDQPGRFLPLLPGTLPMEHKPRKKAKPDFEALGQVSDWILALPSGSKPNRTKGVCVRGEKAEPVDCTDLYFELSKLIPDLNIEGCVPTEEELLLLQRGNGAGAMNAVIRLHLDRVLEDLQSAKKFSPNSLYRIEKCELGGKNGVRLSFTDAATDPSGQIWFLAAAEAKDSTYDDGEYAGSILGRMTAQGRIAFAEALLSPAKPEGLCIDPNGRDFYVVTDADDASRPAEFLRGQLPS